MMFSKPTNASRLLRLQIPRCARIAWSGGLKTRSLSIQVFFAEKERKSQPKPNNNNAMFRVDLLTNAKRHLKFLQMLHANGTTLATPTQESLRRYRDLWLPLVVQEQPHPNLLWLVAPGDVAYLWHCHRLAPVKYISFIQQVFGADTLPPDPNPPFSFQSQTATLMPAAISVKEQERACEVTRDLWSSSYPSEPFFVPENNASRAAAAAPPSTLRGFDLLASTERQRSFLWQVSRLSFQDDAFLKRSIARYFKFLRLKPNAKQHPIVPTYDIDLMWHTHILSSLTAYQDDCQQICGEVVNHNDSLNDRTEGSDLNLAYAATKQLWKESYVEEYTTGGAMYRGEPPPEYFQKDWVSEQSQLWTPLGETSPDGNPSMVLISERKEENKKSREVLKDYVLGTPLSTGKLAHYHISTRQAFEILQTRLELKIGELEQEATKAEKRSLDWLTGKSRCLKQSLTQHQEAKHMLESRMTHLAPVAIIAGIPILEHLLLHGSQADPKEEAGCGGCGTGGGSCEGSGCGGGCGGCGGCGG